MTAVDLATAPFDSENETPDDVPEIETEDGLFVCPHNDASGGVCGKSFPTKRQANSHSMSVHKLTLDGKPIAQRGEGEKAKAAAAAKGDDKPSRPAAPKPKAVTSPSPALRTDRAKAYGQSIATYALMLHLVGGRVFDNYDLDVVTKGSPRLGSGLAAVGEKHEAVRNVCDMIFLGGDGGAYVELILALAMVAVPIAAHHGWLPAPTGERFGAMLGAMAPETGDAHSPPAQPMTVVTPTVSDGETPAPGYYFDPATATLDEWLMIMGQVPTHIMADMANMMAGNGPTVVNIPAMPGTEPMQIVEEHDRGSAGANGTPEAQPVPAD